MTDVFTVGIDPDSERHGFAVYLNGTLITCATTTTIEILKEQFPLMWHGVINVSIEDVMANQFVYARNVKTSKAAQSKVAMHIGRCQQAQVELIRWLDHIGMGYELHKPQKGNWAKDKAMFERMTGWTGRSNEDGRSAAYFGYLALKK